VPAPAAVRVVALSPFAGSEPQGQAGERGAHATLGKDVDPDRLVAAVREVCGRAFGPVALPPPDGLEGLVGDELERVWGTLAAAPVAMAVVGPDGRFLRVNAALCALVGHPPAGGWYEWQWGSGTAELLQADWSHVSAALAALGHPVRLLPLRQVLSGAATVTELQERAALGTSGQLYHHLRQLVNVGWLRVAARGRYAVPPDRVVPLLVVLAAARRDTA
jgi:hypothetical protein